MPPLPIESTGIALLITVGIVLPVMAIATARRLAGGPLPLPRNVFYAQTIAFQLIIAAVAIVAAYRNDIPLIWLPPSATRGLIGAALLLAISVVVLVWRWPSQSDETHRRVLEILPHDRRELPLYFVLCVVAGFAEEVIYRGATYGLLMKISPQPVVATLIASVFFALGHAIQGWRSVGAIFVFSVAFHALVIFTGSLLPAIVVHMLYDAFAGIWIPRVIRSLPPRAESPQPPVDR